MDDKLIPLSEQYRINIKNAIELIDNTLELVEKSNVVLSGKHLKEILLELMVFNDMRLMHMEKE